MLALFCRYVDMPSSSEYNGYSWLHAELCSTGQLNNCHSGHGETDSAL